jgi:hypothetical protein
VFNPEGQYLPQFGKWDDGDGELNYPAGISIDNDDTVYVTLNIAEVIKNHYVSGFIHEEKFLTSFGSEGDGPGQFNKPYNG